MNFNEKIGIIYITKPSDRWLIFLINLHDEVLLKRKNNKLQLRYIK